MRLCNQLLLYEMCGLCGEDYKANMTSQELITTGARLIVNLGTVYSCWRVTVVGVKAFILTIV